MTILERFRRPGDLEPKSNTVTSLLKKIYIWLLHSILMDLRRKIIVNLSIQIVHSVGKNQKWDKK